MKRGNVLRPIERVVLDGARAGATQRAGARDPQAPALPLGARCLTQTNRRALRRAHSECRTEGLRDLVESASQAGSLEVCLGVTSPAEEGLGTLGVGAPPVFWSIYHDGAGSNGVG
jgi:hypothetical protein